MKYRYSSIVDPPTYQTAGLCDGAPLRLHQTQESEDVGAITAQWDWRKHVSHHVSHRYRGSLGPEYNFLSVAFSEVLPDRMEFLAYFDEFIFLHDDVVEAVDQKEVYLAAPLVPAENPQLTVIYLSRETSKMMRHERPADLRRRRETLEDISWSPRSLTE